MVTPDPRVDAYIAKAPEYARPILTELRARVHRALPAVVETMKWSTPSFEAGGLIGGLAAFKRYCTFGFWKETLLRAEPALAATVERAGRMTALADLPPKAAFARALKRAAALNAAGVKVPRAAPKPRRAVPMHAAFARALAASKKAAACFARFPPSAKREYLEWIAGARQDDTRARRIEQAVAWIAAGKRRNWKYERC
jgi:hypothetical protein